MTAERITRVGLAMTIRVSLRGVGAPMSAEKCSRPGPAERSRSVEPRQKVLASRGAALTPAIISTSTRYSLFWIPNVSDALPPRLTS